MEHGLPFDLPEPKQPSQLFSVDGKAVKVTTAGFKIKYIRTAFAPNDGRCMYLFKANSDAEVKRLNDEARIPYNSVVEALDLIP